MPTPQKPGTDPKLKVLREQGCLNPRPQDVTDELFRPSDFFDSRDQLQVKYEMLRRVENDGHSVTQAASAFGFSRPSFYQAQVAFRQAGLPGLVPRKRGPRQAHKLTADVVEFLSQERQRDPSLRGPALARLVQQRFQLAIHPRSIERGLARSQKKLQSRG
jgi:transposase